MDQEFGKILNIAKQRLGENIVFLFSSDHGGQWPYGKWNLYEAGIHVPLIVAWQDRISPNTRTEAMVSWIDILPTLIELTGEKYQPTLMAGHSPAFLQGRARNTDPRFSQHIAVMVFTISSRSEAFGQRGSSTSSTSIPITTTRIIPTFFERMVPEHIGILGTRQQSQTQ